MDTLAAEYKPIVLGYVIDKIVGKAKENLLKYGPITTWSELKQALIRNHGERTPTADIIDELKFCRCDSTIENFYNKITAILSKLNNAHTLRGEGTAAQIGENQRLVLKHFIQNLPPLAKNLLGCHDPQNLDAAFDLLNKFGYLSFSNKNHPSLNKTPNPNNFRRNYDNGNRNNDSPRNINNYTRQSNYPDRRNFNDHNQIRNTDNYRNNNNNNRSNFNRNNNHYQRNRFSNNYNNGHYNRITSEQSRRSNNSNRPGARMNYPEPMDISVNENQNDANVGDIQNFRFTPRNDYLI